MESLRYQRAQEFPGLDVLGDLLIVNEEFPFLETYERLPSRLRSRVGVDGATGCRRGHGAATIRTRTADDIVRDRVARRSRASESSALTDTQIDAGPRVAATRLLAGARLPMRPPSRVVMPNGDGELSAYARLATERYRKAPPTEETGSAN